MDMKQLFPLILLFFILFLAVSSVSADDDKSYTIDQAFIDLTVASNGLLHVDEQFDYTFKASFIEREHVSNDTIGLHTVPENLESGEYIVEDQSSAQFMNAHVVVGATWDWVHEKAAGQFINGLYNGVIYYVIGDVSPTATINYLLNRDYILEILETDGKAFSRPWFGQLMTGPQLMAYLCQVNMWLERYEPEINL